MNILYITQYFPPEVGATQNRAFEMATNLVRLGHQVTILTEFPNHPRGIIPPEYHRRWYVKDELEGIRVIRVWVFARPVKTFFTRMAFYLTFMMNAALVGTLVRGPYDLVYATSPPYFVGVTGLWLSLVKRARFVFEVRDLWVKSAAELGEVSNPRVLKMAGWLDQLYYRKARRIIAVTRGIYDDLAARGLAAKLHLIYNGTNCEQLYDCGDGKRRERGWEDKFVVMYAGVLGIAQGLEEICRVIEDFKGDPGLLFVFVGEGPLKHRLHNLQERRGLTNLILLGEVPREEIAAWLSAADCCLVPLKKRETFLGALPSKMFDIMACSRPLLLSVDGEARALVEKIGAGLYVEPENDAALRQAILTLKADPALGRRMGAAGRSFVEHNFSRRQAALELEKVLQAVMNESRRSA
ncbi:MAG TPA: glycosyltransferase family 4 protein [bacterium]|nr:glycosyltransferase family 4 protein [bacterium]HQI47523.1 glycosyltransferase family 4 protein [bacterium]HQJ63100.1 glycosyltransferase family 4 protein [bacterium]